MTDEIRQIRVDIHTSEQLPEYVQEQLIALLRNLTNAILGEDWVYVTSVTILPEQNIDPFVNMLLRTFDEHAVPFKSAPGFIGAKVVPLQRGDTLSCCIILPERDLADVFPEGCGISLVSGLAEELLHVKLYVARWRSGRVAHNTWWEEHLATLCRQFHDEYMVGRMKVPFLASCFPPMSEDDSDFRMYYPNPLAPILEQGVTELTRLMEQFEAMQVSHGDFWDALIGIIYRYFFEPLARDSAYRDANLVESPISFNAQDVAFYEKLLHSYWVVVHDALDTAFRNYPGTEVALESLIDTLVHFLADVGVTFRKVESGEWWLYIDTKVFRTILHGLV